MRSGGTGSPSEITSAPSPSERHAPPHTPPRLPTPRPLKEQVHLSWKGDRRGARSKQTLQDTEGKVGTCRRGRSARDGAGGGLCLRESRVTTHPMTRGDHCTPKPATTPSLPWDF